MILNTAEQIVQQAKWLRQIADCEDIGDGDDARFHIEAITRLSIDLATRTEAARWAFRESQSALTEARIDP